LRTALRHGFSVLTATVAAGADGEASEALYPRQERASSPCRTIFRPNSAKFPKSQHEIISAWRRKLTAQLAKESKGWNRDERTCGGEASGRAVKAARLKAVAACISVVVARAHDWVGWGESGAGGGERRAEGSFGCVVGETEETEVVSDAWMRVGRRRESNRRTASGRGGGLGGRSRRGAQASEVVAATEERGRG
jgi:cell wall-associated NlpC family hydrolase